MLRFQCRSEKVLIAKKEQMGAGEGARHVKKEAPACSFGLSECLQILQRKFWHFALDESVPVGG